MVAVKELQQRSGVLISLDLAGGLTLCKDRLDAGGQASVRETRLNGPDLRAASASLEDGVLLWGQIRV